MVLILMGCCSSSSPGPTRTLVQYEGKTQSFPNVTSLSALNQAVSKGFSDLKSPVVLTNSEGIPFTEETYAKAVQQTTELKVQVKVLKPQEFKDATWLPLAESVFKIEGRDGKVRGTGFVLTKDYAITSAEVLKSTGIGDLKGVFDLPRPLTVTFDPIFAVNLNSGSNESLVLLRLVHSLVDKSGVLLTVDSTHTDGETATLLYYSTKMPVLRALEDGNITKFDPVRVIYSKTVEMGAAGAPLFDGKKKLIGVFVGGTPGIVLNSTWIGKTLKSLLSSLGTAEKTAVSEVLQSSGLNNEDDQEIAVNQGKDRVQRVAEPVAEPLDSIELSDEPSKSDPLFAYSVDFAKDTVSLFDGSGYFLKKLSLEHRLIPGISCLMTPFGLVLTGPDAHSKQNALLVTLTSIERLASMSFEHYYHASVWYKEAVVVISGLTSSNIEQMKDTKGNWQLAGVLPERRAYAPALVYSDIIYLIGGVAADGRNALASILAGNGETWSTLSYEIPLALKGIGAIPIVEKHVLVLFGGFSTANEGNERVWELTLGQGTVEAKGMFKFQGNLHGCQAAIFGNQTAQVSSDSGAIYSYHTAKGRFKLLQNEATSVV